MTWAAAAMAALTAALLLPSAPRLSGSSAAALWSRRRGPVAWVGIAVSATVLVALAEGTLLVLGLIVLLSVVASARLVGQVRRRAAAARREERVLEVCEALAGELASGQPPVPALERSASLWPDFETVVRAARLGADVPTALRRLAREPGAGGLRDVAAAWQVAHGSGAGLSAALGRVADSARESRATARLVGSELASAQATARLVAALPVLALVLGSGLGGDPWSFLVTTPVGLGCLALGLSLVFAGLSWIEAIAAAVSRR